MKHSPIIAIDDAGFQLFDKSWSYIPVFAVIMKGSKTIEGIIQTIIEKDDIDPTSKLITMIKNSVHYDHIQVIFHEGLTIGGFGIIDIHQLYDQLHIPVIIVVRDKPDMNSIETALKENFNDFETRWNIIEKTQNLEFIEELDVFVHYIGLKRNEVIDYIKRSKATGKLPEALRIAHMIGKSVYQLQLDNNLFQL